MSKHLARWTLYRGNSKFIFRSNNGHSRRFVPAARSQLAQGFNRVRVAHAQKDNALWSKSLDAGSDVICRLARKSTAESVTGTYADVARPDHHEVH